jgi:DNA replication ATP-dependent helicase Dna2
VITGITGADLVKAVLNNSTNGVEELIKLTNGQETDWLEFKAAIREPDDNKQKRHDLAWHVSRALIAMMNTSGGAVLVGVDDDAEIIGLDASDPEGKIEKEGVESFIRSNIYSVLLPEKGQWNTSKGVWKVDISRVRHHVELRHEAVEGACVLVCIVDPVENLLDAEHNQNNIPRDVLLIREKGMGRVREIFRYCERDEYMITREMQRDDLRQLIDSLAREKGWFLPWDGSNYGPGTDRIVHKNIKEGVLISADQQQDQTWTLVVRLEEEEQTREVTVPSYLSESASAAKAILDAVSAWECDENGAKPEVFIKFINAEEAEGQLVFPATLEYVKDNYPLMVIQPSYLINVTALTHFDYCPRNYLLDRYSLTPPNHYMMRGTIVHDVFEAILRNPDDTAVMMETCRDGMQEQLPALRMQGIDHDGHYEEVKPHLNTLFKGVSECVEHDDIEDFYFERYMINTDLGLKGKIDALLHKKNGHWQAMELKTGKSWGNNANDGHKFQVNAYHLLLSCGGFAPLDNPCVIYTGNNAQRLRKNEPPLPPETMFKEADFKAQTAVAIINLRNEVVKIDYTGYIPFNTNGNKCNACVGNGKAAGCAALHHYGLDGGANSPSSLTPHVAGSRPSSEQIDLFRRYNAALMRELLSLRIKHGALLEQPVEERRENGRCIFVRKKTSDASCVNGVAVTFLEENRTEFREGDPCLLSDRNGPLGGNCVEVYIQKITKENAVVTLPGNISELWFEPAMLDANSPDAAYERNFAALYMLVTSDTDHVETLQPLLELLINPDAKLPANKSVCDPEDQKPDAGGRINLKAQQDAIAYARGLQKLLLVQGPPGTGKTYTLARIVKALVEQGKNVLIATYTHRAADEVMSKLDECHLGIPVRKLGRMESCAPHNAEKCLEHHFNQRTDNGNAVPQNKNELMQQLGVLADHAENILMERAVYIGTTQAWLSGKFDKLLVSQKDEEPRTFDVAVVDEASQIILPNLVGTLRLAEKWVLVGDHQQLPPVVAEDAAGILKTTLFEMLADRCKPESTNLVRLNVQHRMHQTIADFIAGRFYNNNLQSAGPCAQWRLPIQDETHPLLNAKNRIVLVDVKQEQNSKSHPHRAENEAAWIAARMKEAYERGLPVLDKSGRTTIGVIAPFRAQVSLIRQHLEKELYPWGDATTWAQVVDTVDRFQGDEREIIVFSLCMQSDKEYIPKPYQDERRINVALSRAKSKLCIVGDLDAMHYVPVLCELKKYAVK